MARLRFLAHAIGAVVLTAALSAAVLTGTASACSCLPGDTEPQRYARADHVFSGYVSASTVLERGKPNYIWDDLRAYTVEVDQEYKGDVPATVSVTTYYAGSMCGLSLYVGESYLVFAFSDSADDEVSSNMCSGTRSASSGPPVTTTAAAAPAAAPTCAAA
ncbi:hypothetical protein ALI22I_00530 [Saccharothrix sp. ALI-22-I]|uniref:hypothetical protein n=1 Tax=Saccharothrix sp. ALI-22-I TaxID=1933778 RepID=UPI00097C2155|nr:hypothetical protein [Saccharothrix sp. ALI-22-I]ONI93013.1 hypothetical protein ALI22I_00530 [Saccharothrix sp. ALI-22-I]